MNKNYDKNSSLWKVLESRDRTIAKGIKNWDKQDKEISLLRKTLKDRKKALNEKDEEIYEKDDEIRSLKRILDVRVEKLKELERIRSSWPYRIIHAIRHPQKLFKNNSRKGQDPK